MEVLVRVVSKGAVIYAGISEAQEFPLDSLPAILKNVIARYMNYEGFDATMLAVRVCVECFDKFAENTVIASVADRGAWIISVNMNDRTVKFRSSQFAFTFEEFAALNTEFLRGFDWNEGIIDDLAVVGYSNHPYYRERLHKIKRMLETGRSVEDVATALGVSIDVVRKEIIDHMARSKRK